MKRAITLILSLLLLLTAASLTGIAGLFAPAANAATKYSNGDIITFGSYPQSEVTDSTLKSALTNLAGSTSGWTSYNYYIESTQSDFMKYKDVTYNGEKYRGVYFTSYRPVSTGIASSTEYSFQDDNGYYTRNIYWFRYEPVRWTILDSTTGLVVSNLILDAQEFCYTTSNRTIDGSNTSANKWKYSGIRAWMNDIFYCTAFSSTEQKALETCLSYDSALSDKVTALSYYDAKQYWDNDTERMATNTDYAKCQGVSNNKDNETGGYWLCSAGRQKDLACMVFDVGEVFSYGYIVDATFVGVRPALCLNLSSSFFESIPSTSVSLSKATLPLTKGSSSTLTATMSPSDTTDTVSWKSSNTSVATVSNGKVTAIGTGTATITAITTSGKTATCTVQCTEKLSFIYGDINNDKKITVDDARLCLRASIKLENYATGTREFLACDVDDNGKITVDDARLILRVTVMLDDMSAHHTWKAASCTTPKTCKDCGVTVGSSGVHS